MITLFKQLPTEIAVYIAQYLDLSTLLCLYSHCPIWRNILDSSSASSVWKYWCHALGGKWKARPAHFTKMNDSGFIAGYQIGVDEQLDSDTLSWREWFLLVWKDDMEKSMGKCVLSERTGCFGVNGTTQISEDKGICALQDGNILVWDIEQGSAIHRLNGHSDLITSLQSHSGKIISGSHDGAVRIWNLNSGLFEREHRSTGCLSSVRFNSFYLFAGNVLGHIHQWDLIHGNLIGKFSGHQKSVTQIQSDMKCMVSSCLGNEVRVWLLEDQKCIRLFKDLEQPVSCLHFNESFLVAGLFSGNVKIWKSKESYHFDGDTSLTLKGHSSEVSCVQLVTTSGITKLVTSSRDGSLRIWDCNSGKCILLLAGHSSPIGMFEVYSHHFPVVPSPTIRDALHPRRHSLFSTCAAIWILKHSTPVIISISLDGVLGYWCFETGKCIDQCYTQKTSTLSLLGFSKSSYTAYHAWNCTHQVEETMPNV